ncbi:MAG: DnaJ domain-containing protein, partial [Lentisphaeria bacterium]|nr:DnaJ domain-containing protein [Lentisphaeria bacterium]
QGDMKKQLIDAFNAGKTDPRTFPQCVLDLAPFFPDRNDRANLMQTFCVLATADGTLDSGTKSLLTAAEEALDLSGFTNHFIAENFQAHSEEYKEEPRVAPQTDELADAYRILEIPPASTDAEVKQARRKKLLEYHPDRIQGKGLPDSFIAFAAEQTRKINEAYELIAARRGMKNQ